MSTRQFDFPAFRPQLAPLRAVRERLAKASPASGYPCKTLKETSGGDTAEERFPEKDPNQEPSPASGVENYLPVGAGFRVTTTKRTIPGHVLKGIGTIVETPPGIAQFQIPNSDGRRNRLKCAPKIKRRGHAVNITEEYLLSGPQGWLDSIYSAAQLT